MSSGRWTILASEARAGTRASLLAAGLLAFAALSATSPARSAPQTAAVSEPSPTDKETARNLYLLGNERFGAGNYEGALEAYQGADRIMNVPTTGFAVGLALDKLDRLLEARDRLLAVTRQPIAPNESESFTKARSDAAKLADELRERIPTVAVLVIGAPPGARIAVFIDGQAQPPELLGQPRSLDPGAHVVLARVSDVGDKSERIGLVERQRVVLRIDVSGAGGEGAGGAGGDDGGDGGDGAAGDAGPTIHPLVWVGFGTALAGAVVGTATGIVSLNASSEVKDTCVLGDDGRECPVGFDLDGVDARQENFAHASTASFVIAGAGLGVGIVGLILSGGDDAQATWSPYVGPTGAGMRGQF